MSKGNKGWNPYFKHKGGAQQRQTVKPLFSVNDGPGNAMDVDEEEIAQNRADKSFSTVLEPNSFPGWKLYFPEKSFKDSFDIVRRVKIMEQHFKNYILWYDPIAVEESCELPLKLQNLEEDEQLEEDWPTFSEELKRATSQTLACIGLAMHNLLVQKSRNSERLKFRKIFVRPFGYKPQSTLNEVRKTNGELVSVTGTVFHVDPKDVTVKMVCFRCTMCSTELVVKQDPNIRQYVFPSSCHKGCPARSRFVEMTASPFTIVQAKQMICLKDTIRNDVGSQGLNVELTQNNVDLVVLGASVTVIGVVKHKRDKSQKYLKKGEANIISTYLKCFALEIHNKLAPLKSVLNDKTLEFINVIKTEPSIFRLLVHSLCRSIYGREEIKAGLILSLLSGKDLIPNRRSESHVLLVGNPGAGKSKLLLACTDVSSKAVFVSGPTSTAVGLTASINSNGSIDAGALILADEGVCCIDEFDKMKSHSHVLLECMEQQMISITKNGVINNSPCRASIIAAANPTSSFYDKTKTIVQNMKISPQLLSRFDLIFPVCNHSRQIDEQFLEHDSKRRKMNNQSSFFDQSRTSSTVSSADRLKNLHWLYLDRGEEIESLSSELLKVFIQYARENIKPIISTEARDEIKKFFQEIKNLSVGDYMQTITMRHLEGLLRLTLARARADLEVVATREHAIDVINLFKFSMIDVFSANDPIDLPSTSGVKKKQAVNLSSMSKPKQLKAFLEHLQSEAEAQERSTFSSAELKEMGRELGIRDMEDIIFKLNMESVILKTPDGFRLV